MNSTFPILLFLVVICLTMVLGGVPWIGVPSTDNGWMAKHNAKVTQTILHKSEIQTIFFGDSITGRWDQPFGIKIWNQHYASRHAYNYGIDGDRTEHLIWRIAHGEFLGVNAKLVVLMIGNNNIWNGNTEADTAHGIKEVINKVLLAMPSTKILLLGIIPINDPVKESKFRTINTMISKYADNKHVFFLDMSPHFQDAHANQIARLYADGEHLSEAGFQVWYQTMEPLYSRLSA